MARVKKQAGVTSEMLIGALAKLFSGDEHVEEAELLTSTSKRRLSSRPENAASKKTKLKKVSDEFKAQFSLKELKEILQEVADVTSVAKVPQECIDDVIAELNAELDANYGNEEEEEDEESEVTVDAVRSAVQAYQKQNGKDKTDEVLEDYGIKSTRGLGKLEQVQLEDLYADVTED